jgi:hypothetical protein
MRANHFVPLAMLVAAACAGQPPAEPWQRPDGGAPSVTDTSFCRQEARRQANVLYPGAPANDARGLPRTTDERNFPAEIQFYEQCMTRLGYMRAAPPAR